MPNEIAIINESDLKSKIYVIRGVQVMLDMDLAEIYGYETKRFNEQVKNNIEIFDDDFRFQLTDEELKEVSRSKISTLNNESKGRGQNFKYNPYAFTEQGIYMLMTVLRGDLAVAQSKDAGNKICTINKIENTSLVYQFVDAYLLQNDKVI